jgi:hypothetical protein
MSSPAAAVPAPSTGLRAANFHWWPTALGILFALGQGLGVGGGFASIVIVCAVIYLFAAVTERPGFAWIGFAASIPLIGLAFVLKTQWPSLVAIAGLGVVLVLVGLARGSWRTAINRWQLGAAGVFGAIAIVSVVAPAPVTGILVVVGLIGHAVWDLVHHARNQVVSRRYSEFCAALDLALAVVVVVLLFVAR